MNLISTHLNTVLIKTLLGASVKLGVLFLEFIFEFLFGAIIKLIQQGILVAVCKLIVYLAFFYCKRKKKKSSMEKGKKSLLLLAAAGAALAVSQPAQAQAAVTTKMPNGKTMNIYSKVSAKGPSKKVSSTKYFKTSKIQVSASKKTKKGYYDYMYANGRPVGWVKEGWFLINF